MIRQLGINPAMDELALENGLGHWSCVSLKSNTWWRRSDGVEHTYTGFRKTWVHELKDVDYEEPIEKDRQQPRQDLINELNNPTRTEEINGLTIEYDLFGGVNIKIEDFVYVHINYDHRYTNNSARKELAERITGLITGKPKQQSLVQKPFDMDFIEKNPNRCVTMTKDGYLVNYMERRIINGSKGTVSLGIWYSYWNLDFYAYLDGVNCHRQSEKDLIMFVLE